MRIAAGQQDGSAVEVDPQYFRPTEVEMLLCNPAKAREKLGWKAEYSVEELAKDMIEGDREEVKAKLPVVND